MENPNLTPDQVVEKINTMFGDAIEKAATKEDLTKLSSEVAELKSLEIKSSEIEKAVAKMEGALEAMKESAKFQKEVKLGSVGEQVVKGYSSKLDVIKGGHNLDLEVKNTTIIDDYTGTRALTELEPGVNGIARQVPLIQNLVSRGTTSSKFVTYIQQTLASTASWIGEGTAKLQGDLKYAEVTKEVKKVAGLIKVSKEMLDDLDFVRSEINSDLMETITDQIENNVLNGTGVGANLEGILVNATTFAAGGFAASVVDANIADVLRCAIAQAETNKFMPTHIVLHPRDVAKIHLTKTAQGEYTYGAFVVNPLTGQPQLMSLTVIPTTWMAEGTFLVGDMKRDNLKFRENMNISVGYVNDDFQKNFVSILCEARLVNYIKANDFGAFIKGNIATAIAAIDKP
jgi:HK97 family phage major capsid protein